jgi:hypothetical protein
MSITPSSKNLIAWDQEIEVIWLTEPHRLKIWLNEFFVAENFGRVQIQATFGH